MIELRYVLLQQFCYTVGYQEFSSSFLVCRHSSLHAHCNEWYICFLGGWSGHLNHCRWDASCTETVEWQEDAGVQKLAAKADQPFYQVLVDWSDAFSDRSIFSGQSLIAYVAQDMLSVPEVRNSLQPSPRFDTYF